MRTLQSAVSLQVHEVFRPISNMARRPSAWALAAQVSGSGAEQVAGADLASQVLSSARY